MTRPPMPTVWIDACIPAPACCWRTHPNQVPKFADTPGAALEAVLKDMSLPNRGELVIIYRAGART